MGIKCTVEPVLSQAYLKYVNSEVKIKEEFVKKEIYPRLDNINIKNAKNVDI